MYVRADPRWAGPVVPAPPSSCQPVNDGADARRAHLLNVTDIVLVAVRAACLGLEALTVPDVTTATMRCMPLDRRRVLIRTLHTQPAAGG